MPLSGTGMLITLMDVLPQEEADFNHWYDKEHLAERVQINGFLEARRYEAVEASPKYLNLYTTRSFDVLDSDDYKRVLQNQTEWSRHHIPKFLNGIRALARISISVGQGRGGYLATLHMRPTNAQQQSSLREVLVPALRSVVDSGLISAHLVEGDAELSRPLMTDTHVPSAADWFVLMDATHPESARDALRIVAAKAGASEDIVVSTGLYRLLWDLSKSEL